MPEIIAFGELLVDLIGDENKNWGEVKTFHKRAGGAPANFAVACSKLGMDVGLVSKVGKDPFGDFLIDFIESQGVETDQIMRSDKKTTLAFASLDENSVPDFMFYRDNSADIQISEEDIDIDKIEGSDLFYFGSLSLVKEPIRSTLFAILKEIEEDTIVSCDPNLRKEFLDESLIEKLKEALNYVNHLILSEDELGIISKGKSRKEKSYNLIEKFGLEGVAITRGDKISEAFTSEDYFNAKPLDLNVVDTTGAGDAFAAGYLTGLLRNNEIEERLKLANIVAACCIKEKGGMSSLPSKKEVEIINKRSDNF